MVQYEKLRKTGVWASAGLLSQCRKAVGKIQKADTLLVELGCGP